MFAMPFCQPARSLVVSSNVFLALLITCCACLPGQQHAPNILMIAVDDLNDWSTPTGGGQDVLRGAPELWPLITPNLQRLALMGATFENAQCASPACNSSRAALMSSISPAHSGLMNNDGGKYFRKYEALRQVLTLPQHLKQSGYLIKTSGKIWHSSHSDSPSSDPTPSQYARAATDWDAAPKIKDKMPPSRTEPRPYDVGSLKWAKILPKSGTTNDQLRDGMSDYRTAQWAARQVKENPGSKPLFLACGIFRPHMPWNVPIQYFDRFPIEKIQIPTTTQNDLGDLAVGAKSHGIISDHRKVLAAASAGEPHRVWKEAIQAYLASTAFADDAIGVMIDEVELLNRDNDPANDWIVLLWGDHGWHLGEKQRWRKFSLWEEATHSTMIVAAPGITKPGSRIEVPVDYLDVYPTIAELAGVAVPEHCHGTSFIDLLKEPESRQDSFAVTVLNDFGHSVRSRRFRYIRFPDGSEELYDMLADPMAFVNLASNPGFGDIKSLHRTELMKYSKRVKSKALATDYFSGIDIGGD